MKTELPERITTLQEAKNFLQSLFDNGEAYHPEDDAHDIVFSKSIDVPTLEERDHLNELRDDIYMISVNMYPEIFDPCGFFCDMIHAEEERLSNQLTQI